MRLVGSEEMRAIERIAIEEMGIPAATLMERAGRSVADAAAEMAGADGRVVVVCGAGNNGGDGFVAARVLHKAGRGVLVVALGAPGKGSPEYLDAWRAAEDAGVPVSGLQALSGFPVRPGDLVVDAILGTGLSRPPEGAYLAAIDAVALLREQGMRVLAVDLPSGLSADTGRAPGAVVRADATVTLGYSKIGLELQPGAELAGELSVVDIGIPPAAADRVPAAAERLDEGMVRALVPVRPRETHKGDAGRVLVVAGSPGKTGAAHLALCGALRGGAGLVTLAARAEVVGPALAGRPEAMSAVLPGNGPIARSDVPALQALAAGASAMVIGPGIPRGPETAPAIRGVLDRHPVPTVLDADAVNAVADHPGLASVIGHDAPIVLTPHPGEMARLVGASIEEIQGDRVGIARRKAQEWGAVVVLKGARTVVADPDGPAAIVPTGNPGMATGGTGDVLAGLIGALLAGGLRPREAARVGAWVHGRAGDLAARRHGERGLVAGDLAESIGAVWVEWQR
ncbi:MAG TPA: NAD(P)H-hydrate dehydratase [Anaeromyxobacteraceae bacterium]|nr:NAD(P)H-hydrate dehydratase [Anaeromyxobacteraceae bacterium]